MKRSLRILAYVVLVSSLSGCLGTQYLRQDQKMLDKQIIEAPKSFNKSNLADLPVQKPNKKFLWLNINLLVWMYHIGENRFINHSKQKFIEKRAKIEAQYEQQIAQATDPRKISSLQFKKRKKTDALDKKIENGNLFMQWGEPLAVFDSVKLTQSLEKMNNYLFINGYFRGKVTASTTERNRKVTIRYSAMPDRPYFIDTIAFSIPDERVASMVKESTSLVAEGDQFSQDKLTKERERIDYLLKDNGYFAFSRQYIDFQVDTTSRKDHKILLRMEILNPTRTNQHRQYHVDSVSITTDVGRKFTGKLKRKAERYESMTFSYFFPEYNKKILAQRVFIKQDSLYSRTKTINTQRQLANLDIFKFVNVNYDTAAFRGKMVANFFLSALDKYSWSNEAGVTVTQGFPGPYISTSLKKRNLFGGLEILELSGRFGFEGVASATEVGNFYQSTEGSINGAIGFPQFLFPFSRAASFRYARYNPRTRLSAGYTYTDRPEYQRRITTVAATFSWDINQKSQFTFSPTNLSIIRSSVNSSFDSLLVRLQKQGNNLKNAFDPAFVGSMIFSFTRNNNYGSSQKSSSLLRTTLESGGTILNFFTPQFIIDQGLQPFQYLRFNVDFRKNIVINKKTSFAWRINTGVGYAYSANRVLPYEKNFFAGGSNSVRAWRPRRLGVGSEPPQLSENPASNGYFDYRFEKPGDLLIEGSMEWRQKLIGFINYALFVDAGNVWSLRTTSKAEAQFNWSNFYEEFAVGTGFGIRFDFSFLILRLDVGIKAWDPARPVGQRWVLNRAAFGGPYGLDREPVIYNIGIGYPF